jgi:hypothetical protein
MNKTAVSLPGASKSACRTLFALLMQPALLHASQREIAAAAEISLGAVNNSLRALDALGLVVKVKGQFVIVNRAAVIKKFPTVYELALKPYLKWWSYRFHGSSVMDWVQRDRLPIDGAYWSGEAAASKLFSQVKLGHTAEIYCPQEKVRDLIVACKLIPDPKGELIVRQKFWNFPSPHESKSIAPPLLIYADLLASKQGRALTIAEDLYAAELA